MQSIDADLLQLQHIAICQDILTELEPRGITDYSIVQKLIQYCKSSQALDAFVSKVNTLNLSITQQFIQKIYDIIRKKLPRQADQVVQQIQTQTRQKDQNQQQGGQQMFPGLSLPNEQIDIDLDDSGSEQSIKRMVEIKTQKQEQQSVKYKRQRSRSRSWKRSERNHSYSSQRHNKKQKKQKKEKKQKKQKKQKKRKNSDSLSLSSDKDKKKKQKKDKSKSKKDKKQKKHSRSRQRSRDKKPIEIGRIFKGRITRVSDIGCYVQLENVQGKKEGLVHISQIRQTRVTNPFDVVKQGQKVWVKIIDIVNGRIRLSIKEVNQDNGQDLSKRIIAVGKADKQALTGALTGIKLENQKNQNQGRKKKPTSPELWQLNRLKYMGGGGYSSPMIEENMQETIILMNDRQPPFLKGQTTKAGVNLSPVRIVKNPQGTLQRQALNAVQFSRERRDVRQKQRTQSRDIAQVLDDLPDAQPQKAQRKSIVSSKDQKTNLPIFAYKKQLIEAVKANNVLIVIGETGSGKTTQITQYLLQAGYGKIGKIGCTQPRRVAAMSVSKRVCQQMGVKLGQQVGYSIRFQDFTSSKTLIKYMTDGMLLREALIDKYLTQYSCIMLDQAHQRTIHTDVLFGILKKVVQRRKDFTLIVTSATLEAKKFSSYFFDCKIFRIPGRTFPVQILYSKQPESDYLDAALLCVMQIHFDEPPGDILLFLTGQQQIDTSCQILNQRLKKLGSQVPQLIILPVYSALPSEQQTRIFEPAPQGKRKCVIATNIAQASLTIDGIYYVVDPGFAKIKMYNSKIGMDSLMVAPISQASAKQRAGRAGRTGPGKCYRLYTQDAYMNQMLPVTVPEIQRANLSNTVLELKAMGINDLINFDFMDRPPIQTLIAALQQLYYLAALDDDGLLTKLGRRMAEFPLQPTLSKMLLTSVDLACSDEIVTIIAMLSVQNIFYRPKQKQQIADQRKARFNHHQGDHLTYLTVYEAWKANGYSATWCHENFIQGRSMKRAQDVRKQIVGLLDRYKFQLRSCGGDYSLVRKAIVAGFFFHAAKKDPKQGYKTVSDEHQVYIHPSSALFNKQPQWVVYHQLVFTTKQYMRDVCTINPKWLIDVAPNFFKFTDEKQFIRNKRHQKLQPLNQKYGDPNAWRLSKRKG